MHGRTKPRALPFIVAMVLVSGCVRGRPLAPDGSASLDVRVEIPSEARSDRPVIRLVFRVEVVRCSDDSGEHCTHEPAVRPAVAIIDPEGPTLGPEQFGNERGVVFVAVPREDVATLADRSFRVRVDAPSVTLVVGPYPTELGALARAVADGDERRVREEDEARTAAELERARVEEVERARVEEERARTDAEAEAATGAEPPAAPEPSEAAAWARWAYDRYRATDRTRAMFAATTNRSDVAFAWCLVSFAARGEIGAGVRVECIGATTSDSMWLGGLSTALGDRGMADAFERAPAGTWDDCIDAMMTAPGVGIRHGEALERYCMPVVERAMR